MNEKRSQRIIPGTAKNFSKFLRKLAPHRDGLGGLYLHVSFCGLLFLSEGSKDVAIRIYIIGWGIVLLGFRGPQ